MNICIMSLGTRGDVQPYVALAVGLKQRNHQVIICSGESFRDLVEGYGITFAPVTSDLMAMLASVQGQQAMYGGIKHLRQTIKYFKEVINPAFRASLDDFWQAAASAQLIIYHPKVLAAVDMAEALNIACLSMPPVPISYPVSEFPNLALSPRANFGKFFNKLTYKIVEMADLTSINEINDFRVKTLALPKRKAGVYTYQNTAKAPIPILYPISPSLFREVESWRQQVFLSGFFFLPPKESCLNQTITQFITAGEKPIVISFSSMPLRHPKQFIQHLSKALTATNNRAIILVGNSGLTLHNQPNILVIPQADHRLLFAMSKGVVHHGGVGTMASALYAGVPQLIIPFFADQPFWAHRLYKLGYALKPLKQTQITAKRLIIAFTAMENAQHVTAAKVIQATIQQEDGVANAVAYIEQHFMQR